MTAKEFTDDETERLTKEQAEDEQLARSEADQARTLLPAEISTAVR